MKTSGRMVDGPTGSRDLAILVQALVFRALPFLFSHGCVEARWPLCRFGASGSARATLRTTATSLS